MIRVELLERAVSEIIDCGYAPDGWSAALDTVALAADSAGVTIIPVASQSLGFLANEPARMLAEIYHAENWHERNFLNHSLLRLRDTGLLADHEILTRDELFQAPIVKDFLRPKGFLHFAACHVKSAETEWWVHFQRSESQSFFDASDQSFLRKLLAPLDKVARITSAVARSYSVSFMQLDRPLLLLDRSGRVSLMNKAAEDLLEDVFSLRDGRLMVPGQTASDAIERHILRAMHAGPLEHVPPFVHRCEDAFAVFDIRRLQPPASGPFSPYHTMITITVPSAAPAPDPIRARSLFSFTRRETDLALALCRNYGLTSAAKALDMKHETARMHLKSIFTKTRTSSQSELVAILESATRQPFRG